MQLLSYAVTNTISSPGQPYKMQYHFWQIEELEEV